MADGQTIRPTARDFASLSANQRTRKRCGTWLGYLDRQTQQRTGSPDSARRVAEAKFGLPVARIISCKRQLSVPLLPSLGCASAANAELATFLIAGDLHMHRVGLFCLLVLLVAAGAVSAEPLSIGDTFVIDSKVLGEQRRINVFIPPGYAESGAAGLPVIYMPDGGVQEDFLHVAGLVHILSLNGSMQPHLLVGIENTERRRDLTPPTRFDEDRAIAWRVGGSAAFRRFIATELIPYIDAHYRTTDERALVGESLAGLFVVETLLRQPELFDHYLAFDPSLWWDRHALADQAIDLLAKSPAAPRRLFIASSSEKDISALSARLAEQLTRDAPSWLHWSYQSMPDETHGTIYHPALLKALRWLAHDTQPAAEH